MLKRTDINPERIPTGKKKLSDVAKLVHARILQIKPETIILFSHHIILGIFEYLCFKPL